MSSFIVSFFYFSVSFSRAMNTSNSEEITTTYMDSISIFESEEYRESWLVVDRGGNGIFFPSILFISYSLRMFV
ncbi:uncharacterized protein K460DRAFT_162686 [Cucurbitaria berberidis CBS 394.84]|uniref:Uncharacterized protein n=1 Tax=Cucurbitaria berberidis CBS 394.84 TaxID=1168544 RepID=A0A9P4GE70_9PLEO|nr:uncharacterized protein K460DRAFT_162686 [Cucurbitaria berberidis CBS 394.84]KAF1844338.1 hypothetical protein K460DRAFT_162686 [Cucurbitaria berberidis CBS 394.84]